MRKHFLILMLLALLPLTVGATLIKVTPYNISKYYGQPDAGITLIYDAGETPALSATEAKILRAGLYISRNGNNSGEAVGDYTYTLGFDTDNMTLPAGVTDADVTNFNTNFTVAVQGSATLSIRKMPLSNLAITVGAIADQQATGAAIDPDLTVTNTANGEVLEKGVDYTVAWSDNVNGPIATGILTGKGDKYSGTKAGVTFNIKQGIANAVIALTGVNDLVYNATSHVPSSIVVTLGGIQLDSNTDYDISYTNSSTDVVANATTYAGTVTVVITGKGAYSGTATTTYEIGVRNVTADNINITNNPSVAYTGQPVYAAVTAATADGFNLTAADYDITTTAVDRTTTTPAEATLTLKGNFAGNKKYTYAINPKAIAAPTITFEQEGNTLNHYVYTKAPITPAATVLTGEVVLEESDYTLRYDNDNNADNEADVTSAGVKKAIVSATADGNYTFDVTEQAYTIDQRPLEITVANLAVGVGSNYYPVATIGNLAVTPSEITLKQADGVNAELNASISFTYSQAGTPVANPSNAGDYTITPVFTAPATEVVNPNYDFSNITTGTLTITKSQIIVKVVDKAETYGDVVDPATFELEHVSGLAANQVATFMTNLNTTVQTAIAAHNAHFTYDADEMKNAGEYNINYQENGNQVGYITNGNYTISVANGTLTVNRRNINDFAANITYTAASDYTGTAIKPVVTITSDVDVDGDTQNDVLPESEYSVAYETSPINAGEHKITITAKDGGNYYIDRVSGTKHYDYIVKNYTISKINLDITANDGTWTYGSTDKNFTYTIDNEDLVAVDKNKTESLLGFNGDVKVKIVSAHTVGAHENGLMPYFADKTTGDPIAASSTNYTINLIAGDLTINKGTIVAKVKNTTVEYGDVLDDNTFHLEAVSGMAADEKDNFDDIVDYDHLLAKFTYDADEMSGVNVDGYTISYTGKPLTATNYNINIVTDGLLKVEPRKITVRSLDQTADYQDLDNDGFDEVPSIAPAANPTVAIVGDLVGTDGIDAIIDKLVSEMDVVTPSVINIVLKENPLYNVTIDTEHLGHLTVVNGEQIVLGLDPANDAATVATWAADDYQVQVVMNFANRNGRTFGTSGLGTAWKAENWATMVLPFDITVAELSQKLGYAIVNVIDPDGYSTDGNGNPVFKFKLTMKGGNGSTEVLKANRPFVIKLADDVKTTDINFGSRKIVAATEEDVLAAGGGFTFEGTYASKTVTGTENNSYWFLLGDYADWAFLNAGAAAVWSWNIIPFEAYINTADGSAAHEATFIMEELDGNTTEIKTVNVDNKNAANAEGLYNLNGVKLNTVPAQKGIYIQNGKKIVVK